MLIKNVVQAIRHYILHLEMPNKIIYKLLIILFLIYLDCISVALVWRESQYAK